MRGMIFKKRVILPFLLVLLISCLTFAADNGIVTFQGILMGLDLRKNLMYVNERAIGWNQNTLICNEKGSPIPVDVDTLTTKTWVYIEGVNDKAYKRVMAKKIYLLPKYIDGNEKNLYPFIK